MPITAKQQRVLDFIRGYIASNKEAPTMAEIGRQFHLRSSASVYAIVVALEKAGHIKRTPNVNRGIALVEGANA